MRVFRVHSSVGGNAHREPSHYSAVPHNATHRVRKVFQTVLEGAIIILACIIFSLFASAPPTINTSDAVVPMVWSYIAELVFNMLVLVGTIKMADHVVKEMMGL